MAEPNKDTIYVDVDDEITGIIDKLRSSKGKIVALVLPKRATVFQSIVNMKLVKRAADDAKKNLVLITTESGLMPLAGAAGVHVASSLTSKPLVPVAPLGGNDDEETIDEDGLDAEEVTAASAGDRPVGELAGIAAADEVETVELDDDVLPEDENPTAAAAAAAKPKVKKDKKLAVPNFERFRLLLAAGILGLVLLIGGLIFALTALPKATITIKTDATSVDTDATLNLSTTATDLSLSKSIVPAKIAQQQKTYTQQVATTGQKNNGNKASGNVVVVNCNDDPVTLPAGTGFSNGSNTYLSQSSTTVPGSDFTSGGSCKDNGKATINVIAQNGGSSYNTSSGTTVKVANSPSKLTAHTGTIDGGTDSIVQTVTATDISNAKAKINTNDDSVKQTLSSQLKQDGYYVITATFTSGTPTVTNSAEVGDVANNVTVTESVTYQMFGVHEDDLKAVVDNSAKEKIDTSKQSILSEGLDKANFNIQNTSATGAEVAMSTTVVAGPDLDTDTIKQNAAGKKSGAVKSDIGSNPDVTDVQVKLSPFWVNSVPKKTSKITVNIAKPTNSGESSGANSQ